MLHWCSIELLLLVSSNSFGDSREEGDVNLVNLDEHCVRKILLESSTLSS